MTDYRKWDRFEDSDGEEEAEGSSAPVVTKFDGSGGRTIQIGPDGATLLEPIGGGGKAEAPTPARQEWDTKNGSLLETFAWRQSRDEVVVQLFVNSSSLKARDILVTYDASSRLLRITSGEGHALFCDTLLHDIEPNGAGDGEPPVDWELKRKTIGGSERRFLELTLRKKAPFAGVTVWWRSLCVGGPEVDVSAIEGRDSAAAQSTRAAWEEAHALFLSRVAARERVEIDLSEEAEAEAEAGT